MRIPNQILIAVVVLGLVGGTAGLAVAATKLAAKPTPRKVRVYKPGKAFAALAKIKAPVVSVSTSPLPQLNVASLNVGAPSSGIADSFNNFRADKKLVPTIAITKPALPPMPKFSAPTIPTAPPAGTPTAPPTGGSGEPTPNAATCGQFAGMPNAGICAMVPDPNGQAFCRACKSAGF